MPIGGKKWFFNVLEDRTFVVFRNNGERTEEHTKHNGGAYGRVTAVTEPDSSAFEKVLEQKPSAKPEQYIKVSG